MRRLTRLAFTMILSAFLLEPRESRAALPVDIEGGGALGYGTNPSHGPSPLGIGLGVRAGVGVRGFYVGVNLTYYFGGSGNCGGGAPDSSAGLSPLPSTYCTALPGEVSLSQTSVLYGVDIGYTWSWPHAPFLKLRPIVEMGDAEIMRTGTIGQEDITAAPSLAAYRSENGFYAQPGLTVLLVADAFLLGIDGNVLLIPGVLDIEGVNPSADGSGNLAVSRRTLVAGTAHAQIGFRF